MRYIVNGFDLLFSWTVLIPLGFCLLVMYALLFHRGEGWQRQDLRHEAQIAASQAREAEARAAEAQAKGIADAHRAWAGNLPLILFVGGAAVVVSIATLYRGRAHVEIAKAQAALALQDTPSARSPTVTVNVLPADALRMLEQYAAAQGKQIAHDGTNYYLVDHDTGVRQRVKPKGLLNG